MKTPIKSLIVLSTFFIFHSCISNAQEISDVQIVDATITITGSGFGDQSPMVFWDDVEENFVQEGLSDGDEVPTGTSELWTATPNAWATPFKFKKNSESKNNKVNTFYHGVGKKNYLGKPKMSRDLDNNKIYVAWWYRPSKSPSAEGGSNKFIRIWDDPEGYGTRLSWTQMHMTCGEKVSWADWNGNVGKWNFHEIYADFDISTVKAWINGSLVHTHTNCPKSTTFYSLPLFVGLIGFDHGSEAYTTMETSIDDIYIASNLKRIEITSKPDWSPTVAREIVPIKTWSSNVIEGKLNKSSIVRTGANVYLHFFDENGALKITGLPVNCSECPKLQ